MFPVKSIHGTKVFDTLIAVPRKIFSLLKSLLKYFCDDLAMEFLHCKVCLESMDQSIFLIWIKYGRLCLKYFLSQLQISLLQAQKESQKIALTLCSTPTHILKVKDFDAEFVKVKL